MTDTDRTDTGSTGDGVTKVAELMSEAGLCMFTTVGRDGHLISRPMALQEAEFDGDLWFFAAHDSRKVADIAANPTVNVSFQSGEGWVSLSGTAAVVENQTKAEELWNTRTATWFEKNPDSREVALIHVAAEGAEYWSTPGSKVSNLMAYAKAKITNERPNLGEHEVVELELPHTSTN
ncbi:pyridoxamine 5'-phosphate oxidase family protein [Rhodococcus sp. NPDC078407]|uniref:pyridoxamine 5'-phosphate oxidase family protein n=1 Tax=Rhodococcus sp. NPDC078407 TaxID=3364509 RepID=UPI0037CB1F00